MLLYDSLNLIISVVHQSHLVYWAHRSEKVKLRGLDYVAYRTRCASELCYWKTKLLSAMCLVAINILLRWQNTSVMLSIEMQFMLDEEKLPLLTWRPSGMTRWQIQRSLSLCETSSSSSSLKFLEWPKQQRHHEDHYRQSKYEQCCNSSGISMSSNGAERNR